MSWTGAVEADWPDPPMHRRSGWLKAALRTRVWVSPKGEAWVMDCPDLRLRWMIEASVEKRIGGWWSEWKDSGEGRVGRSFGNADGVPGRLGADDEVAGDGDGHEDDRVHAEGDGRGHAQGG